MHTGLRLQKKKHRLIYHNQTLAFGVAPQTFLSYATQWQRWGYGCMQVARVEHPVFGRGLSFGQRLCYFSSVYFYWMSYQKLLFVLTPIVALLSGAFPLVTTPEKFLSYFLPFLLLNISASAMLQGGLRSYMHSERFNILKMHVLLRTIKGLFRSTAAFKVTPKARSNAASLSDVLVPILLCLLTIAATVVGARRLAHGTDRFVLWALSVNIAWAVFYLFMMGSVVLSALRRKEQRMSYRFPARLDLSVTARTKYSLPADQLLTGYARNLNRSGLSLTLDKALDIGTGLTLELRFPARTIQAEGKVVRNTSYKLGKIQRFANGIRFTKIDPRDQDEISKYLFWQVAPRESAALHLTSLSQRED
jgi:PilZ domain-containing protein/glycosyl transferase family 2